MLARTACLLLVLRLLAEAWTALAVAASDASKPHLLRSDGFAPPKPGPWHGKRPPQPPSGIDPVIAAHRSAVSATKVPPAARNRRSASDTAAADRQSIGALIEGSYSSRPQNRDAILAAQEAGRAAAAAAISHDGEYACAPNLECSVVGCFSRPEDDTQDAMRLDDGIRHGRDEACSLYTPDPGPCRSGLPFYRMTANDISPGVCFQYCLGKGLDLSGLALGKECRCGASWRLEAVWNYRPIPVHLSIGGMLDRRKTSKSDNCDVVIFNYTGPLEFGAVPRSRSSYSTADQRYIQRIIHPSTDLDFLAKKQYMEELYAAGIGGSAPIQASNPSNGPVNVSLLTPGAEADSTSASWAQTLESCSLAMARAVGNLMRKEGWTQGLAERTMKCRVPPSLRYELDNSGGSNPIGAWSEGGYSLAANDVTADAGADSGQPRCVDHDDKGSCTEIGCHCPSTAVKEVLLLANGEECWACATHCSRGFDNDCGTLPCRCDRENFEVAVAFTKDDSTSCIKCINGLNFTVEPWPAPKPHNPSHRQVTVPYLVEESDDYALDTERFDLLRRAMSEVENTVPCVRFRRIDAKNKMADAAYKTGHFVHVLRPPKQNNWCFSQNGGNRRRATTAQAKQRRRVRMNATELDTKFLSSMRLSAWLGPSLFWMGYCSNGRWMPAVLRELGSILGLRSPTERPDASKSWRDPWGSDSKHNPHIKVFWDRFVNDSAKEPYKSHTEVYTGSPAEGILDTYSGYAEYDYLSIMHPDPNAGSKDLTHPVFQTLPYGNLDTIVGSSSTFSAGDASALGDLYQCNIDRAFISEGYREGHSVTSLHYTDLSHIVTTDLGSEQSWVMAKTAKDVDAWIDSKVKAGKYQLSLLRYLPRSKAFIAMTDTNRWSRRRASGMTDQRYHVGGSFGELRKWIEDGHKQDFFITDMASDGSYLTAIMTKMPREDNSMQTLFWSANWSKCIETIQERAAMEPSYAVTSLVLHDKWTEVGQGCCGGDRERGKIFAGNGFDVKGCQVKCAEFYNCGVMELNSTGFCTAFNTEFKCDSIDYNCNSGQSSNVFAYGLMQTWVVALTSNTSISEQLISVTQDEPAALKFINTHYKNSSTPARLTSLMQTPDGGFAVVMSISNEDRGAPYWTAPGDRSQRYAVNQPYEGFFGR